MMGAQLLQRLQLSMRRYALTDSELRLNFAAGLSMAEIARKFGVNKSTVGRRVRSLDLATVSQACKPIEAERFTHRSIDALGQINKSLEKVNLLMDACDTWLRDAGDSAKYDVGPRIHEVDVSYRVEVRRGDGLGVEARKRKLDQLLRFCEGGVDEDGNRIIGVDRAEFKHADPRELILKTAAECRNTIDLAADLARMLVDFRAMQTFRNAVIAEIGKVDPVIAREIAEAVQRTVTLSGALGGLESLTSPIVGIEP